VKRVLLVVALSLAVPPGASASDWTLAHARAVLRSQIVTGTDASQPDRPVFSVTLDPTQAARLRKAGRRFSYAGPAHDLLGLGTIDVSFTVEPVGPSDFDVTSFQGPPADGAQPALPLRAAFFYGWFSEAWSQQGYLPFTRYRPAGGFYDSTDTQVIAHEIDAMRYGKIAAGIYSWWGRDSNTDERFPLYLQAARQTPFRWAVYDEDEGYRDPSVDEIRRDLEYIRDEYASKPSYLRIGGRFVVFAYGGAESCDVADRWTQANTVGAYIVLPAFAGFRDCPHQPDSWHFYSASIPEFELHGYAYGICPGFWRIDEQPRLERDLERWKQDVRDMIASGEPLQLVLTFNEWGEGTSVEAADSWASPSGYGAYLDALHSDGGPRNFFSPS